MQLRQLMVMALAFGRLSLPVQAEEAIRLFAPVPAGKVALPEPEQARSAPRALVVHTAPLMRGSVIEKTPATLANSSVVTAPRKADFSIAGAIAPSDMSAWRVAGRVSSARLTTQQKTR